MCKAIHGCSTFAGLFLIGMQLNGCLLLWTIAGLDSVQPTTMGVLNVLEKYLESEAYCRVRMEAALALGHSKCEDNELAAASFLMNYLRKRCVTYACLCKCTMNGGSKCVGLM